MTCGESTKLVRLLNPNEPGVEPLQAHAETCSACRARLAAMEETASLLSHLEDIPQINLVDRVVTAAEVLHQRPAGPFVLSRSRAAFRFAASIVFAVGLGIGAGRLAVGSSQQVQPPVTPTQVNSNAAVADYLSLVSLTDSSATGLLSQFESVAQASNDNKEVSGRD